jgi:hypothetical protein
MTPENFHLLTVLLASCDGYRFEVNGEPALLTGLELITTAKLDTTRGELSSGPAANTQAVIRLSAPRLERSNSDDRRF